MTADPPLPLTRRAIAAFSRYREAGANRAAVVQQCGLVPAEAEALDRLAANLAAVSEAADWWTKPESAGLLAGLAVEAALLPILARSVAPPRVGAREALEAVLRSSCGVPAVSGKAHDRLTAKVERGEIDIAERADSKQIAGELGITRSYAKKQMSRLRQEHGCPFQPPPRRVTESVVGELTERDLGPRDMIPSQVKRDIAAAVGTTPKTVEGCVHKLRERSKRMAKSTPLEVYSPPQNGQGPGPTTLADGSQIARTRVREWLTENDVSLHDQISTKQVQAAATALELPEGTVRSALAVMRRREGISTRMVAAASVPVTGDTLQRLRLVVMECGLRAVEPPELREELRGLLG